MTSETAVVGRPLEVEAAQQAKPPSSVPRPSSGRASLPLRVLLVADREPVHESFWASLSAKGDMELVAETVSMGEAVARSAPRRPDIVVVDVQLHPLSRVEAVRQVRTAWSESPVLVLVGGGDEEAALAPILAGATGCVSNDAPADHLLHAIRVVAGGQSLLDPAVTTALLERLQESAVAHRDTTDRTDERLATLSTQEERVLGVLAEGKTNRQIGQDLFLSEKTVRNYVSSILRKLGVGRRGEAAAYLADRVRLRRAT